MVTSFPQRAFIVAMDSFMKQEAEGQQYEELRFVPKGRTLDAAWSIFVRS